MFNPVNYPWQPAELVDRMIFEYEKIELEILHRNERPIAQLTNLLYNVNRDPNKSKPRSLIDWCLYAPPKDDGPTLNSAIAFTQLASTGRIPQDWMSAELMDEMAEVCGKLGLGDIEQKTVPEIRALVSDRILLLCSTVSSGGIAAEYAIVEEGESGASVVVRDVDSGAEYTIVVDQDQPMYLNGSDAYFNLAPDAPED
jgi:hypothetical protein